MTELTETDAKEFALHQVRRYADRPNALETLVTMGGSGPARGDEPAYRFEFGAGYIFPNGVACGSVTIKRGELGIQLAIDGQSVFRVYKVQKLLDEIRSGVKQPALF